MTTHTPHLVTSRHDEQRSLISGRCTDRTVMLAQLFTALVLASILVTTLWVLRVLGGA